MKQTVCIVLGCCLLTSLHAQDTRFINKEAMVSHDGLEDVREYLLQRHKRIYSELTTQLLDQKKTGHLKKGLEIKDRSLNVHGGKAPALFPIESVFISMTDDIHSPISGPDTVTHLFHRGFLPDDLETFKKATTGKYAPATFLKNRLQTFTKNLTSDFSQLSPCSTLVYDAIVLDYTALIMSQLSMSSRRAILAYIFEFGTQNAVRSYDIHCFSNRTSDLISALEALTKKKMTSEREAP